LNCERRIDTFRTDCGTFAHNRAIPNAVVLREHVGALACTLVARIEIVTFRQGKRGWSDKLRVKAKNRACRITQHTINAQAVLMKILELRRRLQEFTFWELFIPTYDPGTHGLKLLQENIHVDNQVPEDREMLQRFNSHRSWCELADQGFAGKFRYSVHHHAAAAANAHST